MAHKKSLLCISICIEFFCYFIVEKRHSVNLSQKELCIGGNGKRQPAWFSVQASCDHFFAPKMRLLNNRSPGAVAGRILASCLKAKPGSGICLSAHLGEDRRTFSAITFAQILIIIIPHLWLELADPPTHPNRHQITSDPGPGPGNSISLSDFVSTVRCSIPTPSPARRYHSLIISREGLILTLSILPCPQGRIS